MFENINKQVMRAAIALFCIQASASAMNISVFPLYDGIFSGARDISVLASALAMAVVGALATWRPIKLHISAWGMSVALAFALGSVCLLTSFGLQSAALLVLGSSMISIARAFVIVFVGVQMSLLDEKGVRAVVAWAFMGAAVFGALVWHMPVLVGLVVFLVFPCVALALSWAETCDFLSSLEQFEAPGDLAITQPSTFIPLGGTFFACLFFFRVAFGFALRAGATPLAEALAGVPVILFALFLLLSERGISDDTVTRLSVLLEVGGFLLGGSAGYGTTSLAIAALAAGNTLFDMTAWALLANVSRRNPEASLAVIAWGRGLTSVGSVVGAGLGVELSKSGNAWLMQNASAVAVFTMVAFALLVLGRFSFDKTAAEVTPPTDEVPDIPQETLETRCANIAEAHGLTKRESEVFVMLARGRDRAYIEEQLVVSRNTVKAHVKHIYAKLDVHSHQEILDMVEDVVQ